MAHVSCTEKCQMKNCTTGEIRSKSNDTYIHIIWYLFEIASQTLLPSQWTSSGYEWCHIKNKLYRYSIALRKTFLSVCGVLYMRRSIHKKYVSSWLVNLSFYDVWALNVKRIRSTVRSCGNDYLMSMGLCEKSVLHMNTELTLDSVYAHSTVSMFVCLFIFILKWWRWRRRRRRRSPKFSKKCALCTSFEYSL